MRFVAPGLLGCVLLAAATAHADEVQLRSGASIEGQARREGETVVIKVESGEIRMPADEVREIREAVSSEEVATRRRSALAPRDVRGRIELAAYCREHELRATERALLQEVLDLEPDQPQARRLLGYERDAAGRWVDRSRELQAARAAEEAARLERLRATELERERERAHAEAVQARDEAVRARDEALRARDNAYLSYGSVYYPAYLYYDEQVYRPWQAPRCSAEHGCNPAPSPAVTTRRETRRSAGERSARPGLGVKVGRESLR
ncbi:MAG TPA: hypothetical protein VJR89_10605 [Polyangiales bacterium]|nr:hypothetical protein [Polyangiales bacterium]